MKTHTKAGYWKSFFRTLKLHTKEPVRGHHLTHESRLNLNEPGRIPATQPITTLAARPTQVTEEENGRLKTRGSREKSKQGPTRWPNRQLHPPGQVNQEFEDETTPRCAHLAAARSRSAAPPPSPNTAAARATNQNQAPPRGGVVGHAKTPPAPGQ